MHRSGELGDARVVVVGAGAVGSLIAYRLGQSGAAVTLVEPGYPGCGTSSSSFAWLNAFGKFPRSYYRLSSQAISDHRELESELDGRWLTLNGGLHWQSREGRSQYADLNEAVKKMRSWGARIESLTPAEAARLEPGIHWELEDVEEIILVRNEGWVQTSLMLQSVVQRATAEYQVHLVHDEVTGMLGGDGDVSGVRLRSGEHVEADVVVVAAGPQSGAVAALAGANLPVETSAGLLAVSAPAPAQLSRVLLAPDVILRPDGGGRVIAMPESLSTVPADLSPSLDLPDIRRLADRLGRLVPSLRGVPFEVVRKGVRALPPDGYPVVGFDPSVSGLYHAVMHSGVTLCASIATMVVDDLRDPDFEGLSDYRPDRFALQRMVSGPAGE